MSNVTVPKKGNRSFFFSFYYTQCHNPLPPPRKKNLVIARHFQENQKEKRICLGVDGGELDGLTLPNQHRETSAFGSVIW